MKIFVASDHAGVAYKKHICEFLKSQGHEAVDFGPDSLDSVDYPDYAKKVAEAVQQDEKSRGILICGTGIGMALCANKFKGIRAASVVDLFSAQMTREHNDLNVLCLGARVVGLGVIEALVQKFIDTPFAGGRHATRVEKIESVSADI